MSCVCAHEQDLRRVRERAGSTRFDTARSQAQSTGKEKSSRWKSLSSQVGSIAKRVSDIHVVDPTIIFKIDKIMACCME